MTEAKTASLNNLISKFGEIKISAATTTSGTDKKIGATIIPALHNALAKFIATGSSPADNDGSSDTRTVPCARLLVLWRKELPEFIRGEFENDLNTVIEQLGLNFGMVDGIVFDLSSDNSLQEKEEQYENTVDPS